MRTSDDGRGRPRGDPKLSQTVLEQHMVDKSPMLLYGLLGPFYRDTIERAPKAGPRALQFKKDFLAFRTLLCGENPPKAQTWLSMCDIAALVKENPQKYAHGKGKRLVGSAASPAYCQGRSGVEREDDIQVEPAADKLKEKL